MFRCNLSRQSVCALAIAGMFYGLAAHAQNLVLNPGFETGDFSSWSVTNPNASTRVDTGWGATVAHAGSYLALFGNGSDSGIEQHIATATGGVYAVSFWIASQSAGQAPQNHFAVAFGGKTLMDSTNLPDQTWTQHSFQVVASGPDSVISFAGNNPPGAVTLDDISITRRTAPLYAVTLLQGSSGGMGAYSVNALGHACGEAGPAAQAMAWLASGPRYLGYINRDYAYSYQNHAYAINDSDAIVGMQRFVSPDQYNRGFYWTQATGMVEIVPPTGFGHSYAQDINNSGTVIGYVGTATTPYVTQGFRWTKTGGMSLLGSMGGASSTAVAINSVGHIVGTSDTANATGHVFLLKHDGPLTPADDIYPASGTVRDVNDADQVLLWDGWSAATIWQDGQTTAIPPVLTDTQKIEPHAINNHGDVVGTTCGSNYYYSAFLYHNGVTMNLNDALPSGSLWHLTIAFGINDAGQIVGWGTKTGTGSAAFLLTPIVYGDANGDGKVDMTDVIAMLKSGAGLASGAIPPGADIAPNPSADARGFGDGAVDIQDAMRTLRYIGGLEQAWP